MAPRDVPGQRPAKASRSGEVTTNVRERSRSDSAAGTVLIWNREAARLFRGPVGLASHAALSAPRGDLAGWEAAWLATLWAFAAIAAGFAWWNRRGTWSPIGGGVAEYARLTRLRCRRQRRSIRFALALFAAEAAAVVALLAGFDRLTPLAGALLALSAAAVAAWCLATERRVARELAAVEEFERDALAV